MKVVNDDDDLLVVSDDGTIIHGRATYLRAGPLRQGVQMNVNEGSWPSSIARTDKEESGRTNLTRENRIDADPTKGNRRPTGPRA